MPLLWRPSMAVGQATIDADHRRLIELINSVEATLETACSHDDLHQALEALGQYAREHFDREEGLMSCLGYADLSAHRARHRLLRTALQELAASFHRAREAAVSPEERERLIGLLRSWLLEHVLKEDMRLKPLWDGSQARAAARPA